MCCCQFSIERVGCPHISHISNPQPFSPACSPCHLWNVWVKYPWPRRPLPRLAPQLNINRRCPPFCSARGGESQRLWVSPRCWMNKKQYNRDSTDSTVFYEILKILWDSTVSTDSMPPSSIPQTERRNMLWKRTAITTFKKVYWGFLWVNAKLPDHGLH